MSIASSIAADYGNRVKAEWELELRLAYEAKDWSAVLEILKKIGKFYFSE